MRILWIFFAVNTWQELCHLKISTLFQFTKVLPCWVNTQKQTHDVCKKLHAKTKNTLKAQSDKIMFAREQHRCPKCEQSKIFQFCLGVSYTRIVFASVCSLSKKRPENFVKWKRVESDYQLDTVRKFVIVLMQCASTQPLNFNTLRRTNALRNLNNFPNFLYTT